MFIIQKVFIFAIANNLYVVVTDAFFLALYSDIFYIMFFFVTKIIFQLYDIFIIFFKNFSYNSRNSGYLYSSLALLVTLFFK